MAVSLVAATASQAAAIFSEGPLTTVETSSDLNCGVAHAGDSHGEFYGWSACGTLMAADGVLYGPTGIPAGDSASPRTSWTPVEQVSSGNGTSSNPYRIITVVAGGGFRITQTDTYVEGAEDYGTRVAITNENSSARQVTLYRAGDCYLQDSDFGYGAADPVSGAVSCTAGQEPGSRIEQWAPLTPGSHYYESFYDNVWSWVGSQQPFPDSCGCDTHQDNGAGLSWTTTIGPGSTASFSHLTAFSPTGQQVEDSDGDGFPDSWEEPEGGVDTNGDETPDLKLSDFGATPDKPDIFIQVGWTRTKSCFLFFFCSTRNRRPSLAALRDVQQAFDAHGIRLHVDAGPGSLMNPDTGATWGARSRAGNGVEGPARIAGLSGSDFDWTAAFDGYRKTLLPAERNRIFHFALYVGSFDSAGHSGMSRGNTDAGFAGRDFMLAYDVFNGGPTRLKEAGTFMHELGHNLGLSHGGSVTDQFVNYKPNYPSLMNYNWQLSGVYKYSQLGLLDYSDGTLSPVDENSLSEAQGLEPDSAAIDIATKWFCPNGSLRGPLPSAFNVDWNCDGQIASGVYGANINDRGNSTRSTLRDFDDWDSLVFDGGGALGGAGDPVSAPEESTLEEAEVEELEEAAGDLQTVQLEGPGQLSIRSHTSAPLQLTISNNRPEPRQYQLEVTGSGVSLAGLPDELTLAPGETKTLTPTLSAGAANLSAFLEVDAISGDDLTDADSNITEIFVVDEDVPDQPGQDGGPTDPGPSAAAIAPVQPAAPAVQRRLKCKKHFKKRKVRGKVRCVRVKKHRGSGR
ncbi:MAG TPA: hypothetical protein VFS54_06860 [Solirubrobacterales bacterium]|nr:hypothetical protein [Solirubrobacterales bacterium]